MRRLIKKYKSMPVVLKVSFWTLISNLMLNAIGIILTPVFTRLLSTVEYAQYTLYQTWYEMFLIICSMYVYNYASYTALTRFRDNKWDYIISAQSLVAILTVLVLGVTLTVNFVRPEVIDLPIEIIVFLFVDVFCFSSFSLWAASQRYEYKYKVVTLLSLIIGVAGPLLGLILIKTYDLKDYGRIIGVIFTHVGVGGAIAIHNVIKARKLVCTKYYNYIFGFCLPLIPHFLASRILSQSDRVMIDWFGNRSDVGIYSLAYSLSLFMCILNDAVFKSFTPMTYRCLKQKELNRIRQGANFYLVMIAIMNLTLIILAPEMLMIFAPEEYYSAVYVIPSVAASAFYIFLYTLFSNVEYYFEKNKKIALASCGAALLNIILNLVFIPSFGYIAAGYTTLASYIIYTGFHYVMMKKASVENGYNKDIYDIKTILKISAMFTILALAIMLLYGYIIIRIGLLLIIISFCILKRETILFWVKSMSYEKGGKNS